MQRDGRKALLLQVIGQAVAFDLRAGEDDGLIDGAVAQPVVQQLALVLGVVGPVQRLLDVGVLFLRGVDLHPLHAGAAVVHDAHGQLLDARGEGGAEHHGLLARSRQVVDLGQVIGKAQIQHAVGLVHDQELHLVQLDLLRALQVQQAAGRGHDQVGVLQTGDLHLVGHAAHHVGDAQALAVLDQLDGVVRHLLRQLARGAQDQGARRGGLEAARLHGVLALGALRRGLAASGGLGGGTLVLGPGGRLGLGLLLDQRVQHGQQEGGGLTAARLAGDHQVDEAASVLPRAHGQGDDLVLHGGGLGVAQVAHGLHQLGRQAQADEAFRQASFGGFGSNGSGNALRQHSGIGRRGLALLLQTISHGFSPATSAAGATRTGASSMVTKHQPSNETRAVADGLGGQFMLHGRLCERSMQGPGE